SASGLPVSLLEGTAFTGAVVQSFPTRRSSDLSDFTVAITWGDGGSSAGTVTANGGGLFTITGNYTYAEEGNYSISVLITDVGGTSVTDTSEVHVRYDLVSGRGLTINILEGNGF